MKNVIYQRPAGTAGEFELEWNDGGQLVSLAHPQDTAHMNWVKGKALWGTVKSELDLSAEVKAEFTERGKPMCLKMRRILIFIRWEQIWGSM